MHGTILLDLYGTLVEPDWPALLKGRAAIAQRVGLSATDAQRAWDRTHGARMVGAHGSLAGDLAAVFVASGMPRAVSPALLSTLAEDELANWRWGVRLYPDVVPALAGLRAAGLRLGIVTNASAEAASVVGELGLLSWVDAVTASCEAGVLKPELLRVALRTLGTDASDATLVDDEEAQLDGAVGLGLRTVLIRRPAAGTAAIGKSPHPVATDLAQVVSLVAGGERP